jgi:hypothetical protein
VNGVAVTYLLGTAARKVTMAHMQPEWAKDGQGRSQCPHCPPQSNNLHRNVIYRFRWQRVARFIVFLMRLVARARPRSLLCPARPRLAGMLHVGQL